MDREKFLKIMDEEAISISEDKDDALAGLNIIAKYKPYALHGADHDIIYSAEIDDLIEAGIIEEDVIKLRDLGWMMDDDGDDYLCKFV
jgi:hypothetical protein